MKFPALPPLNSLECRRHYIEMVGQVASSGDSQSQYFRALVNPSPTDSKGRYFYWGKLRFKKPPDGLTPEQYWIITKFARVGNITPFEDKNESFFTYMSTDYIQRTLHEIDSQARGGIEVSGIVPNVSEADRFLVNSLIEEPFNSSLLEGAATTREQAKTLIQKKQKPQSVGEQMVLNNYLAMEFIKSQKNEDLTPAIIHELHRILTVNTLDREEMAGMMRTPADNINVEDGNTGEILHAPPPAEELSQRIALLCDFANNRGDDRPFTHPILKAVILHFMLAYDHPYVDGNGRTARALFYWSVVRDGYWLMEYISISKIINLAPLEYGKAFLYVETDDADLTYFFIHQLDVISRAISELYDYIRQKQDELEALSTAITAISVSASLNHRQIALLNQALRSPEMIFLIGDHERLSKVSYLTARKDLEELATLGFLRKQKYGNISRYHAVARLAQKLNTR